MVKGVIYKYISPCGAVYIGQTINECHRRGLFFNSKHYGGYKIDEARLKFGPENFVYERVFIKEYDSKKQAKIELDKLEQYYINLYDSVNNGYNTYNETNLIIKSNPSVNKVYKECVVPNIKHDNYHNKKYKFKSVKQYDLKENLLNTFSSLSEASRETKISLSSISRCCQGKLKRVRTFIFKYN